VTENFDLLYSFFVTTTQVKYWPIFHHTMHVQSVSVRPSVTLVDHDHIGWKSWKLIAWTNSPTSSLFVAQRSSTYSKGNMEKFWGENVHSTPVYITSGWIDLRWRCDTVAVCLLLLAHSMVIFAIAQLSCTCMKLWTLVVIMMHACGMLAWLSGMRCRFAYCPADATATHYLLLQ